MTKHAFTQRVLLYEAIAFVLVAAVPWADELFNLPYTLFGAPGTVRWQEALFESSVILALGGVALFWMSRALAQIRYLGASCGCAASASASTAMNAPIDPKRPATPDRIQ